MSRLFLITSLASAGFHNPDALQVRLTGVSSGAEPEGGKLFQLFRQDHLYTLAQHRSHSSHSSHSSHMSGSSGGHYSHSSHTSHQSSSGGYSAPVYTPVPSYSPPPTPPPPPPSSYRPTSSLYAAPAADAPKALPALSGRSAMFKTIVMHVEVALMGRNLYDGPIDGVVGPTLRAALRRFQQAQGLTVTGTITPETLDALHVPTQ
jgi:His-Xaa-Ser repeat protein HxsA